MNEFFEKTDFGRTLKPKSRKTPYIQDGCPIYEITEKVGNPHLGKGDFCHLDYSHRDHLEVFTHQGKAKCVLNLDGTVIASLYSWFLIEMGCHFDPIDGHRIKNVTDKYLRDTLELNELRIVVEQYFMGDANIPNP